jgi:hypothetical protein
MRRLAQAGAASTILAGTVFGRSSGENCLDPQTHAHYGKHDRYTDGPLNGVVTDHGYEDRGDNKDVGHDPCRAPCKARLLHPDLPLAGWQAQDPDNG